MVLACALAPILDSSQFNADEVCAEISTDLGSSHEDRIEHVQRMLLGDYARRWTRWAKGGLGGLEVLWPAQLALAGPFHPMGVAVLSGQPAPDACPSGRGRA